LRTPCWGGTLLIQHTGCAEAVNAILAQAAQTAAKPEPALLNSPLHRLTSLVLKLAEAADEQEAISLAVNAYESLVVLSVFMETGWLDTPLWARRRLRCRQDAVEDRLSHDLHRLVKTGGKTPFLDQAAQALAALGGGQWAGHVEKLPISPTYLLT
jgi:hypothetical protein